ncbi:MAG: methionine adenosyltransferase [Halobacteriota archaeon]|nr:methionine adenosyltransferase [Halobacteriota archaeon]
MNLEISKGAGIPVNRLPMEIVERKGKGHPDTICDKAAEELSIKLSEYYVEAYGRILHHNVDKCVLVGGQSNTRFGGGEVIEPIYLMLVGRAVGVIDGCDKGPVPIGKFAVKHTKEWLHNELRFLDVSSDIIIDYKIRSGSTDLVGNFDEDIEVARANDTSIGVAFGPMTETEKISLEAEMLLNSDEIKKKYPAIGEDIKVMGVRKKDDLAFIVACAMIASEVQSADDYNDVKARVEELVLDVGKNVTDKQVTVDVNNADDPASDIYYLTVTGTSAEHGGDGQVGRGNRSSGLITPYRPMTLEAAAGKNPLSHVGKTYNVAAQKIVDRLVKEEPDIEQVSCYLVSEIGSPITEPKGINLEVYAGGDVANVTKDAESIVEEVLSKMPDIWKGFLKREYQLY